MENNEMKTYTFVLANGQIVSVTASSQREAIAILRGE